MRYQIRARCPDELNVDIKQRTNAFSVGCGRNLEDSKVITSCRLAAASAANGGAVGALQAPHCTVVGRADSAFGGGRRIWYTRKMFIPNSLSMPVGLSWPIGHSSIGPLLPLTGCTIVPGHTEYQPANPTSHLGAVMSSRALPTQGSTQTRADEIQRLSVYISSRSAFRIKNLLTATATPTAPSKKVSV